MVRPIQASALTQSLSFDRVASLAARGKLQRFDGIDRTTEQWDHLRKDHEIWFEDGDCTVHLYAVNTSHRGPSFKIPLKIVEQTNSRYLLQECLRSSPASSEDEGSDSGFSGSADGSQLVSSSELYIPAPPCATRQEAHLYHIGTRNYFAHLVKAPLVGETLGIAITELWKRIHLWQASEVAQYDLREYLQEQGYLSYVENPGYALASLYFAERTRDKDTWSDAFVHCVGMHDRLEGSEEYAPLSDESKILLAHAANDMKSHISQVTKNLGTFLEDDLGPENLGLTRYLRNHLDRFRSTLHSFYVQEINGYFPPDESDPWGKKLWHGMHRDFQCLYLYLADAKSLVDHASNLGAQGGICVTQTLNAFDERHDFEPLVYTLPLLPEVKARPEPPGPEKRRNLGSMRIARAGTIGSHKPTPGQALANATNSDDPNITGNRLVQEYRRFENTKMEEKTTITEARKVRWLLVYQALQMLNSIAQAPAEVRNATGLSYPLCILDPACPTWMAEELTWQMQDELAAHDAGAFETVHESLEDDRISIHPDCEASCAADYFSMTSFRRTDSGTSLSSEISTPLRASSTLSRTASIRSSVSTLHRSVVGSLVRRNSQRRTNSSVPSARSPTGGTFCETLHELHGSEVEEASPVDSMMSFDAKVAAAEPEMVSSLGPPATHSDAPTLEMHQLSLDGTVKPTGRLRHTSIRRQRRISVTDSDECEFPANEAMPMVVPETSDFSGFAFDFDVPVSMTEHLLEVSGVRSMHT